MGDHHEKAQEQAHKAAYIQIINNLATKLIDSNPKDHAQSFLFFSRVLNNKLILILDLGFRQEKPGVIFEKSLKLLATLS